MPAIHVRNVPEATVAALRERAERHGRSLEHEVLEILENAAAEPAPVRLVTTTTSVTSAWRREDIYGDEDEPERQPTKAEHVRIIEETLARHDTPGATAESIDAALREVRGE